MKPIHKKLALDAVLSVMMIVMMFIEYTGTFMHEVIGFAFFVAVIAHLILERKWIASVMRKRGKSRMPKAVVAKTVVALLLLADIACMLVSSVIISTVLASAGINLVWLNAGGIWTIIHTASAYGLCVFCLIHVSMHWRLIMGAFHIEYDPRRRAAIGTMANVAAGVGVVALGIAGYSAVRNNVAAYKELEELAAAQQSAAAEPTPPAPPEPRSKETPPSNTAPAPAPEQNSESAAPSSSSSSATGICTLCKKRCPLSAPQCDKPYRAGLI